MSTTSPPTESQGTSTRPYLVRALHDWCTDNGFTPYVAVYVDASVQVPLEYVKNNEIVLNVGFEATSALKLGNDFIEFRARFGGQSREILVPMSHVVAIYARENGQGMAFPVPAGGPAAMSVPTANPPARGGLRLASAETSPESVEADAESGTDEPPNDEPPESPATGAGAPRRAALKRVK